MQLHTTYCQEILEVIFVGFTIVIIQVQRDVGNLEFGDGKSQIYPDLSLFLLGTLALEPSSHWKSPTFSFRIR